MDKSLASLVLLKKRLQNLRNARPGELDGASGYESIRYETFETLFDDWGNRLEQLAGSRWAETATADVADLALSKRIGELSSLVAQGQGNGVAWLLSNGFLERCLDLSQTIGSLSAKQAAIVRNLAKDLSLQSVHEAGLLLAAAPKTAVLTEKISQTEDTLGTLQQEVGEARRLTSEVTQSAQALSSLQNEIGDAHKYFVATRSEVGRLHGEMEGLRSATDGEREELSKRIAGALADVVTARSVLDETQQHLSRALTDVKRTGLADAFTSRAKRVLRERSIWLLVFLGAALGLVLASQSFVADVERFTYEALLVALLRRAAIATPLVWLGWYAARQVGRLNRVHEDYEYKAATALAFESYKSEIESAEDRELSRELLEITIRNFGDNPVRLYDGMENDHTTPLEQLVAKLETDKVIPMLKRLSSLLPGGAQAGEPK